LSLPDCSTLAKVEAGNSCDGKASAVFKN